MIAKGTSTRSRAWWLLGAAVVAVAALTWAAWPDGVAAPSRQIATRPGGAVRAEGRTAAADAVADLPALRSDVEAGAPLPELFSAEGSVGLLVVDGTTREPVAGAEVWFATLTDRDDTLSFDEVLLREELRDRDTAAHLRAHGHETRTGADGRCRVGMVGWVRVAARAGDRYGELFSSERRGSELVLPLYADRTLVIEVRDDAGRPAAEVEIVRLTRALDGAPIRDRVGATDVDGRWVRPHAQTLRTSNRDATVEFAAAPLGGTTPAQRIDVAAPPAEPVLFRLPPTGSLTLRVVDSDGGPLTAAPFLTRGRLLFVHPEGEDAAGFTWLDRNAEKRFPYVVLDRRFVVGAPELRLEESSFDGPTRARPDVAVELRLDPDSVLVSGRATDGDHRPQTGRRLQFNFVHEQVHVGATVETDGAGRFEAILGELTAGTKPRIEAFLWPQQHDGPRPWARFTPLRPLAAGRNELGDVTFDSGDVIATGTVRDQDGRPLDGVRLAVERRTADGWEWFDVEVDVVDGRLEIRGAAPPGSLRICRGDIRYLLDEPVEFVLGATDVAVVLTVCGSVPFALVVDEESAWTGLELSLVAADEAAVAPILRPMERDAAGLVRGRWAGVPPGRYRAEVRLAHARDPVAVVDGLVVEPGSDAIDPRLDPLELTGLVRRVYLRVRSAAGGEPGGAVALAPDSIGGGWSAYEPGPDGRIAITVVDAIERVDVLALGHHPVTLRGVEQDRDIELEPAAPLVVAFEGATAWPGDVTAKAILTPVPPNPLAGALARGVHDVLRLATGAYMTYPRPIDGGIEAEIDGAHRATLRPRLAGAYQVGVRLTGPDGRTSAFSPDPGHSLEWHPELGAIRIELLEVQIRAALEELGR